MDRALDPRIDFAEWLHGELVRELAPEHEEAWAIDRVQRVQERLNRARVGKTPLRTTILAINPPLAFTLAGPLRLHRAPTAGGLDASARLPPAARTRRHGEAAREGGDRSRSCRVAVAEAARRGDRRDLAALAF